MASGDSLSRRGVLWDLDGTLADSRDYHWRAWQEALGEEGVRVTEDQFQASFGQRNDSILAAWLGADADPAVVRRIGEAKEAYYRRLVREEGIDPLPGARDWIETLHSDGWRQAIASSAPRLNVEVMHRALGFGDRIQVLVGAQDVSRGKPDPEVFLLAAKRLGISPDRCVVVEDAGAGIEAANRAGMASIGVGGEGVSAARVVVNTLSELPGNAFELLVKQG